MEQALLKDLFEEENTHWWHAAKRKLISEFMPRARGRVLVLGVGGGLLCHELSGNFEVVGLDISPMACEHVKHKYGIDAIVCDLEKGLPFVDGTFDVVIMADVLEHIREDKKLIFHIRRCLKKGGNLILTVPAYAHLWSHWDERLQHYRRYEFRELKGLIGAEDFRIRKITFFNALIYPFGYARRKLFEGTGSGVSDFKISQGGRISNALIGFYYILERCWIHWGIIPFGFSLFVCAEKQS